ncbi:uncharacterized protein N7511_009651 [Penicillium nucicola]|uniref:uncharacterized protein n=1 Tax=Penicillium nucicola TaxID=1850975 RepID=UPI00254582BE|nr:uncharacterized protein N7511_009651 [Penicillium nucicola]KAJ5747955.1 hypothetical protein N7511_009651 [Penicillium nucicola]
MFEKFTSRRTPEKDQRNSNDRPMAVSSGHHAPKKAPGSSTLTSGDKYSLPSRPQFTNVETMEFWKRIFPDAMNKFRSSHPQSKPPPAEYDIRNKQDWQSIYQVLEKARAHYQSRGGTLGDLRFHLRNVADSIAPAAAVARTATQIVLPLQDPILSPVLQAVVILLDAAKMSSVVRQQALQGLGNLTPCFADIEIFLQLFPGDTNILNASLNLTVVVLDTIERGIAFFMSAQIARIAKAAAFGDYYGEGLVKGLDLINEQCSNLLREANKSKDYQVHLGESNLRRPLINQQLLTGNDRNSFSKYGKSAFSTSNWDNGKHTPGIGKSTSHN